MAWAEVRIHPDPNVKSSQWEEAVSENQWQGAWVWTGLWMDGTGRDFGPGAWVWTGLCCQNLYYGQKKPNPQKHPALFGGAAVPAEIWPTSWP